MLTDLVADDDAPSALTTSLLLMLRALPACMCGEDAGGPRFFNLVVFMTVAFIGSGSSLWRARTRCFMAVSLTLPVLPAPCAVPLLEPFAASKAAFLLLLFCEPPLSRRQSSAL